MGYDQHQQSNSTGTVIAVVVAVLLLAVLGIIAVAGAALFFVRTDRQEVAIAAVEVEHAITVPDVQQGISISPTQTEMASMEVRLDSRGAANINGEEVDIDGLKARLTKLKKETNARLSLQINADADCPVKHVVAILDICEEVGDIGYRIVSSAVSDVAAEQSSAEN